MTNEAVNEVIEAFVTDSVSVPDANVSVDLPSKAPSALYCICVFDPPGDPPPPDAAIVTAPLAPDVIVTLVPAIR